MINLRHLSLLILQAIHNKRKGRKGKKEGRKGEEKGKKKREEERGGKKEKKKRGRGRSVAQ